MMNRDITTYDQEQVYVARKEFMEMYNLDWLQQRQIYMTDVAMHLANYDVAVGDQLMRKCDFPYYEDYGIENELGISEMSYLSMDVLEKTEFLMEKVANSLYGVSAVAQLEQNAIERIVESLALFDVLGIDYHHRAGDAAFVISAYMQMTD